MKKYLLASALIFSFLFASCVSTSVPECDDTLDFPGVSSDEEPLKLSRNFGVYDFSFNLAVSVARQGHVIRYTTDGSEADENSTLYENGILIANTKSAGKYILTKSVHIYDTSKYGSYMPSMRYKGVPLSLVEYDENGNEVFRKRGTFLVMPKGSSYFKNVPVVCLSAPVENFIGIDGSGGLYNLIADEKKYDAFLEYYDFSSGEKFSLETKMKLGGNWTKGFACRTINLNFKKNSKDKKNDDLGVKIFPTLNDKKIKRLRLHSGGNDTFSAFFTDAFVQRLASMADVKVATSAYRPCVLFLNGEYWGVYGLREHYNEDYLSATYGVKKKDIVFVDKTHSPEKGNSKYNFNIKTKNKDVAIKELDKLFEFLECSDADGTDFSPVITKDWTSDKVYDEFCKLVDVEGLADLILLNGYAANWDFMGNNLRMWKTVNVDPSNPYADGRWHFILHDTDFSFQDEGASRGLDGNGKNYLDYYLGNASLGWGEKQGPLPACDYLLLSLPSKNEKFRALLMERALYMQNVVFEVQHALEVLNQMQEEIDFLYKDRCLRWGKSGYSYEEWKSQLEFRRRAIVHRPDFFMKQFKSSFGYE